MKRFTTTIAVSVVLVAALLGMWFVTTPKDQQPNSLPAPTVEVQKPATVEELLSLVNAERAKVGVAPLVLDERLNQSAQRKADDMVKYNYFGHVSPNDGMHGYEYINETDISCKTDSENIRENEKQYNNVDIAVAAWKNSKAHREAMLDPKYKLTGFGISGTRYVEHFCEQ